MSVTIFPIIPNAMVGILFLSMTTKDIKNSTCYDHGLHAILQMYKPEFSEEGRF